MAIGGYARRARLALLSLNAIEDDFAQNGHATTPIGPAEQQRLLDLTLLMIRMRPARARLRGALDAVALKEPAA